MVVLGSGHGVQNAVGSRHGRLFTPRVNAFVRPFRRLIANRIYIFSPLGQSLELSEKKRWRVHRFDDGDPGNRSRDPADWESFDYDDAPVNDGSSWYDYDYD